jgi:hypothetical protein
MHAGRPGRQGAPRMRAIATTVTATMKWTTQRRYFIQKSSAARQSPLANTMLKRKLQLHFITRRLEMFATSYYEARLLLRNKP